ncbi:MAG: hypothetical protein F4X65_05585 [Chloroflexi bacterium]|nr:hypothetical protein [Chloroflexota bacterium]
MVSKVPETPLPPPGQSDEAAHAALSQRFREHVALEYEKGNRLQASEKVWASVAQQLKAVAEDRGWANGSHLLLRDIARQLQRETRDDSFWDLYRSVEYMHRNFYENEDDWDEIEEAWVDSEILVEKLEALRDKQPGRYVIRSEGDQARIARLMGENFFRISLEERQAILDRYPRGASSEVGFSPKYGYQRPGNGGDDDDGGGAVRTPRIHPRAPSSPSLSRSPAGRQQSQPREGRAQTRQSLPPSPHGQASAKKGKKKARNHAYLSRPETRGRR